MANRGAGDRRDSCDGSNGAAVPAVPPPSAGQPPPLDQQFDANSLHLLRAAVAAHAAAAGLSADRVRDALIAAHELAANAVRHGAGHGRIRQWTDGRRLHCHVSDPGPADQPVQALADSKPWRTEHGHGLWLVRQVADKVTMRRGRGGADITVIFAINPA
jgi:anti-sigma regulatory factor (Ser/Thr protein kinase)